MCMKRFMYLLNVFMDIYIYTYIIYICFRYRPIEFDGWNDRHYNLPFVGERFSLVWFTPLGVMLEDLWWLKLPPFSTSLSPPCLSISPSPLLPHSSAAE